MRTRLLRVGGWSIGASLAQAAAVMCVTAPVGGLVEADIHWRAGLGWHGLH